MFSIDLLQMHLSRQLIKKSYNKSLSLNYIFLIFIVPVRPELVEGLTERLFKKYSAIKTFQKNIKLGPFEQPFDKLRANGRE